MKTEKCLKENPNFQQEYPDDVLCYEILINQNRKNKKLKKLRDAAEERERQRAKQYEFALEPNSEIFQV